MNLILQLIGTAPQLKKVDLTNNDVYSTDLTDNDEEIIGKLDEFKIDHKDVGSMIYKKGCWETDE